LKVAVLRSLIDEFSIEQLRTFEEQLLEGEEVSFEKVGGEDEGEQLTHLSGAIWCLEQAEANGTDPKKEVKNFISRVRNSIS